MNFKKSKGKNIPFPHTLAVLFMLVVVTVLLTYIIPAGQYGKMIHPVSGKEVLDPNSFTYVSQAPVSFLDIPQYIVDSLTSSSSIIFMVVIACASVQVVIATGALDIGIKMLIKKFANKELLLLLVTIFIFGTFGLVQNSVSMTGFVPLVIMLCRACGYDAMTGITIILLGAGGAYSVGPFSPAITGTAQTIADLPVFSGAGFRIFSSYVLVAISAAFILNYAKKVKANPSASLVYDLEQKDKATGVNEEFESERLTTRQLLVLLVFIANFVILVYGCTKLNWKNPQISAQYLTMAIVAGIVGGLSPSSIAKEFCVGAGKMMTNCLVIGTASSISKIMAAGLVIDTVVHALTSLLLFVPSIIQPIAMYVINICINFFIPSGSGQAAATMPILIPVADMLGMTRQTCVLAFNFGDGLSNFIFPTSSSVMAITGAAGITFDKWFKFSFKVFLGWSVAVCALLLLAYAIKLGPF